MRQYIFSALLFIVFSQTGFSQERESFLFQDPRRNIDSAVTLMNAEKYLEADKFFMTALDQITVLSADFCYYFGKNSFFLNNYAQSIDWLSKYLELKGSRGQYSDEVIGLLDKAESAFRKNRSTGETIETNSKFFYLNTVNCETNQSIICPVCKGDDVIISFDQLGERLFKECPYSNNGVLTCEQYNQLIQGRLKANKK
jgi:tetratricopeptide (TPR) repeat protein